MTDPQAVAAAFPRRPLQLTATETPLRARLIGIGLLVALALPSLIMFANAWRIDAMRGDLRARGVPAIVTAADTTCWQRRSENLFGNARPSCTANISYTTQDGVPGALDRFSIGRRDVDLSQVLYDPQNPNRAMPAQEALRPMEFDDIDAPIMLLILPVIGIGLALFSMRSGLKHAAARPFPAMLRIVGRTARPGAIDYALARGGKTYQAALSDQTGPLLVIDEANNEAFALVLIDPRGQPILLSGAMNEVSLTDDERQTVWRAAGIAI